MSEQRFPLAIRRLLRAGKIDRVDLYAGRLLRDGEGGMSYRPLSGNGNGNGNGNGKHADPDGDAGDAAQRADQSEPVNS